MLKLSLVVCAFIHSASAYAEFNTSILEQRFQGKSAEHSIQFVRLSDGKTLYEKNADKLLSPASVTKIVTGAAALAYFGPAFSFKTPVFYTGTIKSGHLTGDLIIQGNGDPFLVSEILWQTVVDLRHKGIRAIDGDLIIDNSLFDNETRDESRKEGLKFSSHAYDAPVSAFAVNFNTVAVAVAPTSKGKQAVVSTSPFSMKSVKLSGSVATIAGASDAGVSVSRTSGSNGSLSVKVSGNIGQDAEIKKIYRSVADPNVTAADYLIGFLGDAGINFKGKLKLQSAPKSSNPLYEIQGYEMRKIVGGLNTFSNNFIADMLTKRLGAAFPASGEADRSGSGTLSNGVNVLSRFLKTDVGINSSFTLLNGSGLSTENRMSARQITQVLTWMEQQGELFPDFLGSLPASGWDGTLKKRMKKSSDLAGVVRAKTGTLTDPITVAGMAGYFRHPSEGWVAFTMLSNGLEGRGQPGLLDLRNAQDDAIKAIFK